MASTSTKRIWYANYLCGKAGPYPKEFILIGDRPVAHPTEEAWAAFSQALLATGYDAQSVGTYNCRPITGGSGYSLHAYAIAVDIDPFSLGNPFYGRSSPKGWKFSWDETEFTKEQVDAVLAIRTNSGKRVFLWGGYWTSIKDYMHWEVDVPPKDLETGIDWSTVASGGGDEEDMWTYFNINEAFVRNAYNKGWLQPQEQATLDYFLSNLTELQKGSQDAVAAGFKEDWLNFRRAVSNGIALAAGDMAEAGMSQDDADKRYVRRGVQETATFK